MAEDPRLVTGAARALQHNQRRPRGAYRRESSNGCQNYAGFLSDADRCCQQDDDFLEGRSDEPDPRKRGVEKGPRLRLSPEELQEKLLETNFRIMEQIRDRVDREVDDPATAAALKPYCETATVAPAHFPIAVPDATVAANRPVRLQASLLPR